jgi:hypothetical protein
VAMGFLFIGLTIYFAFNGMIKWHAGLCVDGSANDPHAKTFPRH